MKRLLRFLPVALAIAASTGLRAGEPSRPASSADGAERSSPAFRPGEKLTYQVSWGPFSRAGELHISTAVEENSGQPHYRVSSSTATRGLMSAFYKVESRTESSIDARTGRTLEAEAANITRKWTARSKATFDYAKGEVEYVDFERPERSGKRPLVGEPLDIAPGLLLARSWSLRPGDSRPFTLYVSGKLIPLQLHAVRTEVIETRQGKRETVLLEPRPAPGQPPPSRGGELRLWLSTGRDALPLKIEVKTKAGTATAWLVKHELPTGAATSVARSR